MKKEFVTIIIENDNNEVLLQLRDDIKTIKFPNTWCHPGGAIESNETSEEAIKREMQEEMGLELSGFELFKKYDLPDRIDWVFHVKLDIDPEKINLTEGQKIKYFSHEEMMKLQFGFGEELLVKDFFNK